MYYFCTYFDQNYINKGLSLYKSLIDNCGDFILYVLCIDDVAYQVLSNLRSDKIRLIKMGEFEKNDVELLNAKKNRSTIEYYFTCTPSLPLYIFQHWPEVDLISYIDSDLYFFSSPDPIFQEMGSNSILIIGHRFPEKYKHLEIHGIYNVGFLSFRKDEFGLACLNWWRERCIEWCYDRLEGDKFADQKYLDSWPSRFKNVTVLQYKGAGLSPWNILNYRLTVVDNKLMVDDSELIFYHFHGLKKITLRTYDSNLSSYEVKLTKILKENIYMPYLLCLEYYDDVISKYGLKSTYKRIRVPNKRINLISDLKMIIPIMIGYTKNLRNKILQGDFIRMGR